MHYLAALTIGRAAFAVQAEDVHVSPHVTKSGTYVRGHYQTEANSTKLDSYSTKGNLNPYTGKAGTVDPYKVGQRRPQAVEEIQLALRNIR